MAPISTLLQAALALASVVSVQAVPASSSAKHNVGVFIRGENNTYTHSESHANIFRASMAMQGLSKRTSHATVQACFTEGCGNCHTIEDGNFNSFTCLDASSTACIIVSNLDNAKVNYWNHDGCNGNESTYTGCGEPPTNVNAPGTNSIGVQIGC